MRNRAGSFCASPALGDLPSVSRGMARQGSDRMATPSSGAARATLGRQVCGMRRGASSAEAGGPRRCGAGTPGVPMRRAGTVASLAGHGACDVAGAGNDGSSRHSPARSGGLLDVPPQSPTGASRGCRRSHNVHCHIVAPRIHGLNSSSPMPWASLRLSCPDATAINRSKISSPTSAIVAPASTRPASMSISSRMRS